MEKAFGIRHRVEPIGQLIAALAAAEDTVSRLDERTRSPLGDGLCARLDFHEACAWAWNRGELVHLEDLVLHDEELDVRTPDQELTRTRVALRLWRRAGSIKPADLLSATGVRRLINPRRGMRSRAVSDLLAAAGGRSDLLAGDGHAPPLEDGMTEIEDLLSRAAAITTEDNDEALDQWFALEREVPTSWPALLRAALLLEAWVVVDPLPRHGHIGAVLANALLQRSGRLRHHRLHVEIGRRRLTRDVRRPERQSGLRRLIWQLRAIAAGEAFALEEYDRISLARQVVSLGLVGRRSSSRLAEVIELFTDHPIVTASMISERLKVSQQAARSLVGQMGASVVEVTGRARYQAWRL